MKLLENCSKTCGRSGSWRSLNCCVRVTNAKWAEGGEDVDTLNAFSFVLTGEVFNKVGKTA